VSLPAGIAAQMAAEGGSVPFARFMELALTHPTDGYYSSDDVLLGARGHFSTAPVLSPEFNETVARLMEELTVGMAGGATVRLVELGGGEGRLARAVLERLSEERPDMKRRVGYTIVEVGQGMRARQRRALARLTADGWRVEWAPTLTGALSGAQGEPTVVVGNEFVDALPVHLVDVSGDKAREAWVEVEPCASEDGGAGIRETWADLSPEAAAELRMLFGTEDTAALRSVSRDGTIADYFGIWPTRVTPVACSPWTTAIGSARGPTVARRKPWSGSQKARRATSAPYVATSGTRLCTIRMCEWGLRI
jgi:SAM-dependent MidA family methyltransferase